MINKIKGLTLVEVMIVMLIFVVLFAAVLTVVMHSNRSWRAGSDKIDEQKEARRAMDEMVRLLRQANADWVITTCNPAPPAGNGSCNANDHYPITITENGKRLDFYRPTFYPDCCPNGCAQQSYCTDGEGTVHNAGEIRLFQVIFRVNPNDPTQLQKKIGLADATVIANNLQDINFSWGCTCNAACVGSNLCTNETPCTVSTVINTCCTLANCNNNCNGCGNCATCYENRAGVCVPCPNINISVTTRKADMFNLQTKVTLRNRNELPDTPTPTVEESQEQ